MMEKNQCLIRFSFSPNKLLNADNQAYTIVFEKEKVQKQRKPKRQLTMALYTTGSSNVEFNLNFFNRAVLY